MTVENLKDFDRTLFGTNIVNFNTQKFGLILYTWTNVYADAHIQFATYVDENGKKYKVSMEDIRAIEDLDEDELQELGLKA